TGGELRQEDGGQVVGDRRDDREQVQALRRAVRVRDVEDVHLAADEVGQAAGTGRVRAQRPADAEDVRAQPEGVATVGGLWGHQPAQDGEVVRLGPAGEG